MLEFKIGDIVVDRAGEKFTVEDVTSTLLGVRDEWGLYHSKETSDVGIIESKKFKIGDKVRILSNNPFILDDKTGIVTKAHEITKFVRGNMLVKCEENQELGFYDYELELLEEEAPKTYSIEEIIAELRENPTKKFRSKDSNRDGYITLGENNDIVWLGGYNYGQGMSVGNVDEEWIEVPNKPMSFQEVCQAVIDTDSHVEIKYKNEEYEFEGSLATVIEEIGHHYCSIELTNIFLNGKFYII